MHQVNIVLLNNSLNKFISRVNYTHPRAYNAVVSILFSQNIPIIVDGLKNAQAIRQSKIELFNHLDFVFGRQLRQLHELIFKQIRQFDKREKSFFDLFR